MYSEFVYIKPYSAIEIYLDDYPPMYSKTKDAVLVVPDNWTYDKVMEELEAMVKRYKEGVLFL